MDEAIEEISVEKGLSGFVEDSKGILKSFL